MMKKSLSLFVSPFAPLFASLLLVMLPLSVVTSVEALEDASQEIGLEDTPAEVQRDLGTPYTFSIYGLAETSFLPTFPTGALTGPAEGAQFSFSGPFLFEQQLGVAFGFHIYEEASPFARGFLGAGLCLLVERCTLWLQTKIFVGLGFGVQTLRQPESFNDTDIPFAIRSGGALSFALTYGEETFSFGPYVESFVYDYQLQNFSADGADSFVINEILVNYGVKGAVEIGFIALFNDLLYLRAGYHHAYDRVQYSVPGLSNVSYNYHSSNGFRLSLGLLLGGAVIGRRF